MYTLFAVEALAVRGNATARTFRVGMSERAHYYEHGSVCTLPL
jgi:hypothetical protein